MNRNWWYLLSNAVSGLGVIPGVVRRFDSSKGLIVPHIGWNALEITKDTQLLKGAEGHHVYFVHSYHALPVRNSSFLDALSLVDLWNVSYFFLFTCLVR